MVVCSVVLTGLISKYYLPKVYEAVATVMPARQEVAGGGVTFGGGEKGGGGGGALSGVAEMVGAKSGPSLIDTLFAIMVSRVMAEGVSEQLNLMEYYGASSLIGAAEAVRGEVTITATKQKVLQIAVQTSNPQMAADIANAYISNLDHLNRQFSLNSTKEYRQFLEKRLAVKAKELFLADEALKAFQTENRSLALKDQAEAAMASVSDLHGEIVGLEVELAALREYATPSHPRINQLQAQIRELRRQLDRLEQQEADAIVRGKRRLPMSQKAYPSFQEAPTLALELLRLNRKVKVEEAVYGMLVGTYEQAKLAEARDVPTIQTLDPAVPPTNKIRPKTLLNMLTAGVVSFVLGTLLAFFITYLEQLRVQASALIARGDVSSESAAGDFNGNGSKVEVPPVPSKEIERFHG